MTNRNNLERLLISAAFAVVAGACASRHAIVASTATNIGVDIAQNPATQSPHAKLGYQRVELAIVPTNRSAESAAKDGSLQGGALDHGDVIMELRYGGIFDTGPSSGIYQRLAVGKEAVHEPGATMMFLRNADGKVDSDAKEALKSLESIRQSDVTTSRLKVDVARKHETAGAADRAKIDGVVQGAGFASWNAFLESEDSARVKTVVEQLKAKSLL